MRSIVRGSGWTALDGDGNVCLTRASKTRQRRWTACTGPRASSRPRRRTGRGEPARENPDQNPDQSGFRGGAVSRVTRTARGGRSWRRHPDSNRGIRVLQTLALPLGYAAILLSANRLLRGRFTAGYNGAVEGRQDYLPAPTTCKRTSAVAGGRENASRPGRARRHRALQLDRRRHRYDLIENVAAIAGAVPNSSLLISSPLESLILSLPFMMAPP